MIKEQKQTKNLQAAKQPSKGVSSAKKKGHTNVYTPDEVIEAQNKLQNLLEAGGSIEHIGPLRFRRQKALVGWKNKLEKKKIEVLKEAPKRTDIDPFQAERKKIISHAKEVFGTKEKAEQWLAKENRSLHGKKPLDLLKSLEGLQQVNDILIRIEYGVYS